MMNSSKRVVNSTNNFNTNRHYLITDGLSNTEGLNTIDSLEHNQ